MGMFSTRGASLIWKKNHETVVLEALGRDGIRVSATVEAEVQDTIWALILPEESGGNIHIETEKAWIRNGAITAEISSQGQICFFKGDHKQILIEEVAAPRPYNPAARTYKSMGGNGYHLTVRFQAYDGERFYGLGQHQHGRLDQKGCVIELVQRNTEVTIPFLLSSRGYGFLWNNPAKGQVELGMTGTTWVANKSGQIDHVVIVGESYQDILSRYADLTGHAPLLPEWATGFWQSKLRYENSQELLKVAREYQQRGLPLSVIVIDYFHWTKMGEWQFDPKYWPDPEGMVRELNEMGVKVMVSIWPSVNPDSKHFAEMERCGLLIRTERGNPALFRFTDANSEGTVYLHYYDSTNPEAQHFIWDKVRKNYYHYGIKVWWLDACEPEIYPEDHDNLRYHFGNGEEVSCIYPLLHQKAFFDGMNTEGEQEIVVLSRSAWAGSQRYGTIVWSGDVPSSFEALRKQIPAGLNMAMSGIPWWTTDIGGFYGGDNNDPAFQELIIRWFQYGVFCPIFRLHGVRASENVKKGGDNEIWSFGEEAYKIIRELLFLRERLRPYIVEQMQLAHETGIPPMRPLFLDFPEDNACISVQDQFLFGPDILVAPVLTEGARERNVYLPEGIQWTDAWTNEKFSGEKWVTIASPLERIPVFIRGERKLPIKV